jgi:hypothetical protein
MSKTIEEAIITGMIRGYNKNLVLKVDYNSFQSETTEKLFHVYVADELIEWNDNHHYSIYMEYNANDFCNNAFSRSTDLTGKDFPSIFAETKWRSPHFAYKRPSKKEKKRDKIGSLDLAILKEMQTSYFPDLRSIYGIEIKAINPIWSELNFDVTRLKNAIEDTDEVSSNSLKAGFSTFIKRLDSVKKSMTKEQHLFLKTEYENKLTTYLNQNFDWTKTKYEISYSPVSIDTVEDYIKRVPNTEEYPLELYDVQQNTGAVYCVLIKITRK